MSYGSPEWQGWVLGEEEGIKHIKAAYVPLNCKKLIELILSISYDLGIQTFDSANVYSNGLSEVILGKAIKQHNLPRDEIVVMTKVRAMLSYLSSSYPCTTLAILHCRFLSERFVPGCRRLSQPEWSEPQGE
jgi:hypothetical protein